MMPAPLLPMNGGVIGSKPPMNGTVIGSQLDEADWLQERLAKPEPDNSCCHRWDGAAEAATWQRRGARPAAR